MRRFIISENDRRIFEGIEFSNYKLVICNLESSFIISFNSIDDMYKHIMRDNKEYKIKFVH